MHINNIIFWQNIQSFYQAPQIRALATITERDIYWVTQEELTEDRRNQGWPAPDAGNSHVIIHPNKSALNYLSQLSSGNDIHIFSGIGAFPLIKQAFMQVAPTNAMMGLLVENRNNQGIQGLIRLIRHRLDYLRYRNRIGFILAIGYTGKNGGRNWYQRCGYSDDIIFPYCYFPEIPKYTAGGCKHKNNDFNIIYVGQHIHRKGVDILFKALAEIKKPVWALKVIGDGALRSEWMELAHKLDIVKSIQFLPSMTNADAMNKVESSDLFILPSRFDGWGVVINEALLRGVPVVCSDRCGGQDLLQESWRGETFISESVDDLRRILRRRIEGGQPSLEEKNIIRNWAADNISGEAAAKYLLDVIANVKGEAPRPVPPWLRKRVIS